MSTTSSKTRSFERTEAFSADSKNMHAIIETPQGGCSTLSAVEKFVNRNS